MFSPFTSYNHLQCRQDLVWDIKRHAFSRILTEKSELTNQDMLNLEIKNDGKIFRHRTLRVNYTTYDLQRRSDVINVRTRPDIMVLAPEGDRTHPYWYGRVIDIFTVPIHYKGTRPIIGERKQDIEMIWVRWFQQDNSHDYQDGWAHLRLPRLSFIPPEEPTAHSLIAPEDVLRACHIIPAFAHGFMDPQPLEDLHATRFLQRDWNFYYVNM